jgi:hypothetical protein
MEVKTSERRFGKQLSQALSTGEPLALGPSSLVLRRVRDRKMDSLFKQTGNMYLDRATVGGGLTRKRGLNLGCDVNGDCHGWPSKSYGTAASACNQAAVAGGTACSTRDRRTQFLADETHFQRGIRRCG